MMNQEKLLNNQESQQDDSKYEYEDPNHSQTTSQQQNEAQQGDNKYHESNAQLNDIESKRGYYDNIQEKKGSETDRGEFFNPILPFFSMEIALRHAKANRVFRESIDRSTMSDSLNVNPNDICPCCSNVIQPDSELIPIWKSTYQDLSYLGPTYPMYFQFMRYSIAFISIIFLISGIYNLIANSQGDYCNKLSKQFPNNLTKICQDSVFETTAGSNRDRNDPDFGNAILNLITCIVMMIFSTAFRVRQIKFEKEIDKSDISVSDYTVFINKIPLNKTRQDIINFLQSQVPGIKVEKVVQAFKLKKFQELNQRMLQAKSEQERKQFLKEIKLYEKQCFDEDGISDTFCGAAFVSFEKEEQKVKVVDHFDYNYWKQILKLEKVDETKLFDGFQIHVEQAKEPGDTNWENIEFDAQTKFKRRTFTFILTLCFLALSFWAILEIGDEQGRTRSETNDQVKLTIVSTISSILTVLVNLILQTLIQYFSSFEAYNFKTDTIISVAKKSGIAQFINTTIVSFFVMIILNGRQIWINGGLVSSVTSIAVTNALLPAVIAFVSPENIVKQIEQKIFLKLSDKKKKMVSQQFVHSLFELPQFNPAACFAAAANALLFSAFYAWIIPISLPFCIISLSLQFFVNKYKLLRRQSVPVPLGTELPEEMVDFYFEIIIVFYSLGCLAFEIVLYSETHVCTILMVVLSGVFYFAPINEYIDSKLQAESNYIEELPYKEAKSQGHFSSDYDRHNPVLKSRSIQKYINKLIDKEQSAQKKETLIQVFYVQPSQLGLLDILSSTKQDIAKEELAMKHQSINIETSS
ncbi:transmembrane protein, putative (macronuclear) [Tetrahymena thermophila SB210]|uniref:Transmembrane protein, putative n=1 Tax=Tetrahymena thermophila (strain SB210) TaxID=312017 RepID=Q22W20_TETTS|nr:transmembrane protein, putative [Tetrahymena thermophila SB210]EAR89597.2 transmembrane protein, putative [Tetrahymena thermophila SB210]|eukprot:XP_001009842.2 transmembrane protein, putative [Tetrahymena thermophila SB210]